jgi:hypothetical protein
MSGINKHPLPGGQVTVEANGHLMLTASGGRHLFGSEYYFRADVLPLQFVIFPEACVNEQCTTPGKRSLFRFLGKFLERGRAMQLVT